MKKNYFIQMMLVVFGILFTGSFMQLSAQNYFYVGTATTTSSGSDVPFYTFYHDKRTSYMILASELQALGATGDILSLALDVSSPASQPMNGFNIKMGQTTASSMSGFLTGLTTVYSATSHTATSGWNNFTFTAPFNWDGTSNVVVEICFDNSSYTSSSTMYYTSTSFTSCYGQYADSWAGPGCSMTTGGTQWQVTNRPNTRLEFTPPFANDASVNALINPTFPTCAMDSAVSVRLFNSGTANLTSAIINWSVNGSLQPAVNYSGNLAPFSNDTVSLGTVSGGLNDGDVVMAWSSMPNSVPDSNNINDTLSRTLYNSLSGVYTIDPSGAGDFLSFTDAVNAMDNFGICAATTFEAVNGTYVEQIDLENYTGMDYMNTVTFTSQSGNPDSVTLAYSSTGSADNYVVRMLGAPYFSFTDMTIENLGTSDAYAAFIWGSDSISFDNCHINCASTWYSSGGIYAYYYYNGSYGSSDYLTVNNCIIDGGSTNIYYYQYSNTGDNGDHSTFTNNQLLNCYDYGFYGYYGTDLTFDNNYVTSSIGSNWGYGVYIGNFVGGSVSNNYVEGSTGWPYAGMYLNNMTGDLTTFMPVTNNRLYVPGSNSYYGLYQYGCLFTEFSYNSVYLQGQSSGSAFYSSQGAYNVVKNNIFQVNGSGYATYKSGSGIYQMDYNNLSAPNGNVGYSGGALLTMMDWQNATGFDGNSVTVNGIFSDTATLKVCTDSLFGMGISIPAYTMDFQGDARQNPPCIGADEFLPISQFGFNINPVLCTGDTLVLSQYYFDTVVWNGIDTSNVYSVTAPGSQSVSVYDACGTGTSNFTVIPQENAFIGDTNLCEGTTAVLGTGISGGSYMWSNGSTDSTISVNSAQTVSVMVVDANGCTSADTAVVTQSFDVVLNDTSFCEGESVALNANMSGTYSWSNGSTNQTLNVSAPGTYSVTVTDQNCISSSSATVVEILNVVPSFTDSSSYFTVAFTNTTQNATSYLWDFGDGTTSTDVNPVHFYPWSTAGVETYVVTLTAYNSCGDDEFVNDGVRAGQAVSVSEVGIESMINVYPNPNNGLFNVVVKTTESSEMNISVIDSKGSLVYNRSLGVVNGEVNSTVQLENAAQGIYFVKVTLNGETAVYRLVVE